MKPVIIQFDADENYHTVVEVVAYNMDLKITDHATNIKQSRKVLEKVQQKKNMVEIIKEEMSDLMKNPSEKDDIAIAYLAKVLKKILTSPNKEQ